MAHEFAASGADLELSDLVKVFGDYVAVDQINVTIPAGSFFALLGPSGCGKTTTLRMIAGLEGPSSGSILIGGKDVSGTKPHQRQVNTVFQSYALFPHMTILENVAFGLRRRHVSEPLEKAHAALQLVELDHIAHRRPSQLSGGQQQRVALARALVNRPALLLLDEPLGALDLKLRRQMQLELKTIQADVGLTFLHVTHDQEEAMTMADTIAVMNKGRIEQMGPPEELYDLPRTEFVAGFLGQSNTFPAEIVGRNGDELVAETAAGKLGLLVDRSVTETGHVRVGVRPEKITLWAARPPAEAGRNLLGPGTVTDVSFTGVSTQYSVEVPGLGSVVVFAQNMVFGPVAQPGATVWLTWSVSHGFGVAETPVAA